MQTSLKWPLANLKKIPASGMRVQETVDLSALLADRFADRVISMEPVTVDVIIEADEAGRISAVGSADTVVTLPSSRSLTPVALPIHNEIDEWFVDNEEQLARFDQQVNVSLVEKTVDLGTALLESLMLALPTRVLTPDEAASSKLPQGTDWAVTTEETAAQQSKPNTPLAGLASLLEQDGQAD
ncbi:YceD family protein [Weissella halotolerans]|uniref:Nucleic acid-binding protein n=1 Tax=Weissella halotolerans DSM 20190 TaxID=1123500 RepID=A0A0R2FWG0_9LACO|nr:YceD family protein [Weissella halotolerans]KRN32536.1 hypothetical protein IV68_GL000891 [Weissella halotolerans DSM 20190]